MSIERVGYARLVDRFDLPALALPSIAVIDSSVRGRAQTRQADQGVQQFPHTYRPDDTPLADLQFALRYEGVNLHVLALLFAKRGPHDIQPLIEASPQSAYARRLGYLYEWLTEESLPFATPARSSYVALLDDKLQFGLANGARNGYIDEATGRTSPRDHHHQPVTHDPPSDIENPGQGETRHAAGRPAAASRQGQDGPQ
ncbi:MAG: hypothetical protein EHM84_03760, partial [Lysobacterales bacterium]